MECGAQQQGSCPLPQNRITEVEVSARAHGGPPCRPGDTVFETCMSRFSLSGAGLPLNVIYTRRNFENVAQTEARPLGLEAAASLLLSSAAHRKCWNAPRRIPPISPSPSAVRTRVCLGIPRPTAAPSSSPAPSRLTPRVDRVEKA